MSKPSRIDPERLAALMEGKLSASEAAIVRADLAASDPEVIESFADAAVVANELGMTGGAAGGSQPRNHRTIYAWIPIGALVAAALVFAVVKSGKGDDESFSASGLVAQLPPTIAVPANNAWPTTRGGEDIAPSARAARLGAVLVDLQLAMRSADSSAVRRSAATIVALGDGVPGASPWLSRYQALALGTTVAKPTDRSLEEAETALTSLAGSSWVAAGGAGETVRAVVASGDSAAVDALCANAAELSRQVAKSDLATKDSLIAALKQRPCNAARLGELAARFLTAVTR